MGVSSFPRLLYSNSFLFALQMDRSEYPDWPSLDFNGFCCKATELSSLSIVYETVSSFLFIVQKRKYLFAYNNF